MESLNKNGVSITQTPEEEKYLQCCIGAFREQIFISMTIAILTAICFLHWLKRLKNVADSGTNG